ncbi:hypothetical protein [Thiorhodospira sibirica]|uniref:hypothetical protein n=1 Tax=Thiorhodospira sibirica TaxID=154347 RepID=UPI00022C0B5E|nr:hypothetical protein [Thiorhodospira sibirica]
MYEPHAFQTIRNAVHQKTVTLLGSAPGAYLLEALQNNQILVCANAAALGVQAENDWKPEITLINTAVASSPNAGKPTRERLHQLKTKKLIIIESGYPLEEAEKIFKPIEREITETITLDERCQFLEAFLEKPLTGRSGDQHVPSTGFFSLLTLIQCGAKSITPIGFSFNDGHSYLNQKYQCEHIDQDKAVLRWILEKGYPVEFSSELIECMVGIKNKGVRFDFIVFNCQVPYDNIPKRSYPLFLAREILEALLTKVKAEQREGNTPHRRRTTKHHKNKEA